MFARSFLGTAARTASTRGQAQIRRSSLPLLKSASLFTASVGLGTCPKRRRKQSNKESGEDAYFINLGTSQGTSSASSSSSSSKVFAGVFDGVGGWADSGVDPSVFSHGLARHCDVASERLSLDSRGDVSPSQILVAGYNAVQKDSAIEMGSSTACVASVNLDSGVLKVANLGDSGYLIVNLPSSSSLHNGDDAGAEQQLLVHASKPQTYFFNAPYQLAKMPDAMRKPGSLENRPQDADLSTHKLTGDEVVILATDGFFDNVFGSDAAKIVYDLASSTSTSSSSLGASNANDHAIQSGRGKNGPSSRQALVNQIARTLTDRAREAGRSRKDGPFAEEAKAHRLRYEGGKEDDICVVVISIERSGLAHKAKL